MAARVLIVEDEQADRVILGNILEGMGHQVYFATDGEQAFKTYMRRSIDVVVTDLLMPHVDGLEFIVALKTLFPDAPVIAVSATGPEMLAAAVEKGASVSFAKPVDPKSLLAAIAEVVPDRSIPQMPKSKVAVRGNYRLLDGFEFEYKGEVRCVPAGSRLVDLMALTTEPLWDILLDGASIGQVEASQDETKETVRKAATKLVDELPVGWIREKLAQGALANSAPPQEAVTPEVVEPPLPLPGFLDDTAEDEPLLKAAEVATMLGISTNSVYALPIERVRVSKRTVRWRRVVVREFIEYRDESPEIPVGAAMPE
jgi:CheY-like chemotaxis protein/predicted DNA-binding transcriptional regulator AlpA